MTIFELFLLEGEFDSLLLHFAFVEALEFCCDSLVGFYQEISIVGFSEFRSLSRKDFAFRLLKGCVEVVGGEDGGGGKVANHEKRMLTFFMLLVKGVADWN